MQDDIDGPRLVPVLAKYQLQRRISYAGAREEILSLNLSFRSLRDKRKCR